MAELAPERQDAVAQGPKADGGRSFPWIGAGIAILVVLMLLALFRFGLTRTDPALVERSGPAREFALELFPGQPSPTGNPSFKLSELRGHPVVLNFWASWCVPCQAEVPALDQTWRRYQDQGLIILGIDIQDTEADALAFMKQYGANYPNGPDPTGAITIDYGVVGVPETFFIDRDGQVRYKYTGPVPQETLDRIIAELMQ